MMKGNDVNNTLNLQNTEDFLGELESGNWFLAETGANEAVDDMPHRGSVMCFSNGELAIVLSCTPGHLAVVLPVSSYHSPASSLEILLPNSKYVVCTWDVRYQRRPQLMDGMVIETLSNLDLSLLNAHYNSVHRAAKFPSKYAYLLGAALECLPEDKVTKIKRAMQQQASRFQIADFAKAMDEEELWGGEVRRAPAFDIVGMASLQDGFTSMPNAAATKPEL